jgi:hypothetical protein
MWEAALPTPQVDGVFQFLHDVLGSFIEPELPAR